MRPIETLLLFVNLLTFFVLVIPRLRVVPWLGVIGPIDGARANSILGAYTLAFFDKHLKGQPAPLLDRPSEEYPEVHFEAHRP